METTHTEPQGDSSATVRSFDLDAMGLGPPTKVRRRGKIDKWTRILGVLVVLLLVFNIGVRLGHASRPKAATTTGGGAGAGAGSGAAGGRAGAGTAGGKAGAGARGGQGGAASQPVGADPAKAAAAGTVKYVDGNNIYVSQPDGTTKRVVNNESTRYVRTQPSTQRDVQPGDHLVVEGQTQPDGSVTAIRVTDNASSLQQP